MGILMWVMIGLVISVLTLMIEPYIIRRHIPLTILLGVGGAMIGGAIGSYLGFDTIRGMHFMIIVFAIEGAVFLLTWYRTIEKYF